MVSVDGFLVCASVCGWACAICLISMPLVFSVAHSVPLTEPFYLPFLCFSICLGALSPALHWPLAVPAFIRALLSLLWDRRALLTLLPLSLHSLSSQLFSLPEVIFCACLFLRAAMLSFNCLVHWKIPSAWSWPVVAISKLCPVTAWLAKCVVKIHTLVGWLCFILSNKILEM